MNQRRLLVIDDEPINLQIIQEYLEGPSYVLELLGSGGLAWQRLDAGLTTCDIVILDRMMPGMSGLELLRKMKADERFRRIPVIMQTAAATPEQVREGIEAGAYYYLAKPYQPETLLAIVRAALADIEESEFAHQRAGAHVKAMELLDHAAFHFQSLTEVGPLIEVLASLCPDPEIAATGLTELLVNAVEHGNLGITYAEKKALRLGNKWEEEVARRMTLPEYSARCVRVEVERQADRIQFTISDEGNGFEWQRYLDFDASRASDPNGRGIAMARMMSFSSIEYRGKGNTVSVSIARQPGPSPQSAS